MKGWRLICWLVALGLLLPAGGCGKKGPPFLKEEEFQAGVRDLKGEWVSGDFFLKGTVYGPGGPIEALDLVKGCRIYYVRYPIQNPPCEGCPIDFQSYYEFGPEVIGGAGFRSRVPGEMKGRINFFEVRLLGPGGAIGPPSNRVRVPVE